MTSEYLDLGVPMAIALTMLKLRERDFTQREIADIIGVSVSAVQRALSRLESHQIVRRTPRTSIPLKHSHGRAMFVYRWSGGPMIGGQQ